MPPRRIPRDIAARPQRYALVTNTAINRGRSGNITVSTTLQRRVLTLIGEGAVLDNQTFAELQAQIAPRIQLFRPELMAGLPAVLNTIATGGNARVRPQQVRVKMVSVVTVLLRNPTTNTVYVGRVSTVRRQADNEGRFRGRGFIHANDSVLRSRFANGVLSWPGLNIKLTQILGGLERQVQEANYRQSGLTIMGFYSVEIRILRVGAVRGGTHMQTPPKLHGTRAVINVRAPNDQCFKYSVLAALHPDAKYCYTSVACFDEHADKYDWARVSFPSTLDDVIAFEEDNPEVPPIHVFEYDCDEPGRPFRNIHRLYTSFKSDDQPSNGDDIVLLLLTKNQLVVNDDGSSSVVKKQHYVWCKNAPFLFRFNPDNIKRYCYKHRREHKTDAAYIEHLKTCTSMECTHYQFPKKGAILEFKRYRHRTPCPVVYYCDIECLQLAGKHTPCMFAYYACSDNPLMVSVGYKCFTGPDCIALGLEDMFRHAKRTRDYFVSTAFQMIAAQEEEYGSGNCCECGKPLEVSDKGKARFRHSCDVLNGVYKGRAHPACAINWQTVQFPAFHHNGRGYDHHFILTELFNQKRKLDFVIAQNMEKITCMDSGPIRFVDSLQHLACSLEKAVSDLRNTRGHSFDILSSNMREYEEVLEMLCKKQPFPYEWFRSWESLNHVGMVPAAYFRSVLRNNTDAEVQADYEYAKAVFEGARNMTTMSDFMRMYLQTDVLLLAEVMQWYRSDSMIRNGGLDPAWYITAPSLALDEVLLHSLQQIELFHEDQEDMFNMVLGGIRGGIVQSVMRDAKTTSTVDIRYFDANSLYPWAMRQPLPVGGYEWCDVTLKAVLDTPTDSEYGYFVEIDCDISPDLHDFCNDLPPCPEKREARPSPAALLYMHDRTPDYGNDKLMVTLDAKKDYCVHYILFKTWMHHKLLSNVVLKRALRFRQTPFVRGFIDMNVRVRAEAKGRPGVQNNCKRKMNSVFGKWMENVFKREDVKFCANSEDCDETFLKHASKTNLKCWNTFGEPGNLFTGFSYYPEDVILDKPIPIGGAILDISKSLMYDAFYTLKREVEGVRLVYMDTDSLVLAIPHDEHETSDDVLSLTSFGAMMDSSGLPDDSPLKEMCSGRDKVPGYFKDELGGACIDRFIGLRAKTYCYTKQENTSVKCKGVPGHSTIVESDTLRGLAIDDFIAALYRGTPIVTQAHLIRSVGHVVSTIEQQRIALSGYDDKRWICDNLVDTYAHGHRALMGNGSRRVVDYFNTYSPTKKARVFQLMYVDDNVR